MSAVSSVSNRSGSDLFSLLRRLQGGQTAASGGTSGTAAAAGASAASATSATTSAKAARTRRHNDNDGDDAQGASSSGSSGVSPNADFFQKLQASVTTALADAKANGGTTDANQVVTDAIAKAFKDSGISLPPPPQGGRGGPNGPQGSGPEGGQAGQGPGGPEQASRSAFFQTLQSYGIDPKQFHADFLSAVKGAQNGGSSNASSVLQNIPAGSQVDTVA
jgi:hypothetical protein